MFSLYLADLMHDHFGYKTVPYAIGCVGSYAKGVLGNDLSVRLFRSPNELAEALIESPPDVMGFSNYAWNATLSHEFVRRLKAVSPRTVVVMGGPHYPTEGDRQQRFFEDHPDVDFYVQQEGEIAFTRLLQALVARDFDAGALKSEGIEIDGCHYVSGDRLINPLPGGKIKRLETIPSPYLNGLLDRFLEQDRYIPLAETKRGCPFSCTFCVEGLPYYNTLGSGGADRFEAELDYIAQRMSKSGEDWQERPIMITDANFGMYKEDLETCRRIARIQERYGWPRRIDVATGKNHKQRIIEASEIANGAFYLVVALQSTDPATLRNVKRTNIPESALFDASAYNKERGQRSYSELMLGLPGETKQAHLRSVATVMNAGIDRIFVYPMVLLPGTEMETVQSRKQFGIVTKYGVMAYCFGQYRFGEEQFDWGEPVEHVIATAAMPAEDLRYCWRFMLSVEIFYSDNYFEEITGLLRHFGIQVFEFVHACHELIEAGAGGPGLRGLYDDRDLHTLLRVWESAQDCLDCIGTPEQFAEFRRGESASSLGNQKARAVLHHTAALHEVARQAAQRCLQAIEAQSTDLDTYLEQAARFSMFRKRDLTDLDVRLDGSFDYAFLDIEERDYTVAPADYRLPSPAPLRFLHDSDQAQRIRHVTQESKDPITLMRALVYPNRNDTMKTLFRRASRVS